MTIIIHDHRRVRTGDTTLAEAKAKLTPLGIVITKQDSEYRVTFRAGSPFKKGSAYGSSAEAAAVYTDDLDDAIASGIAMAKKAKSEDSRHMTHGSGDKARTRDCDCDTADKMTKGGMPLKQKPRDAKTKTDINGWAIQNGKAVKGGKSIGPGYTYEGPVRGYWAQQGIVKRRFTVKRVDWVEKDYGVKIVLDGTEDYFDKDGKKVSSDHNISYDPGEV